VVQIYASEIEGTETDADEEFVMMLLKELID
jgi:hypothetical protein